MAPRSWFQRARSWEFPSAVRNGALAAAAIAAFSAAVVCVAALPDRYATALQATGGLALLVVTAIYVSHTRRQANILAAQARAQAAAPRMATLRLLLTKMTEWRGKESMAHLRMHMLAAMLIWPEVFDSSFTKAQITSWFTELDDSFTMDVQEEMRLAVVDFPDSLEKLSRSIVHEARQQQLIMLQFVDFVREAIEASGKDEFSRARIAVTWEDWFHDPLTERPTWGQIAEGGLARRLSDTLPPFEAEARRLVRESFAIADFL